jgi:hypothetical protein
MQEYTYEVTLGPAALLAIVTLGTSKAKEALADALRSELESSPNPRTHGTYDGVSCIHQALLTGHTAVFNAMTKAELEALGREGNRRVRSRGFYVYDLLSPGSGITSSSP